MSPFRARLLIVVTSLVLFVPFLGSVRLFDWDEVNFAECAREMIVTGDYLHMQIDFMPFYEKPPVFVWLQVCSMKVFGVTEFAARLPNALVGVATMLVLFSIGSRIHTQRFGFLWCIVYAGSLLPHFYFKSGIIDPLFNLFIFLGLWFLGPRATATRPTIVEAICAGVFCGLAVMTKGPVGFALVLITAAVAWLVLRKEVALPWREVAVASVTALGVSSIWFLIDYVQNGPTFVIENLAYQVRLLTTGDAGHGQPWYYHGIVVLIGCYPASIFFLRGLRAHATESTQQRVMRLWMIVLFFVVLVVFSVVKTKIVHYSSMTYIPLTYLAAVAVERWISGSELWTWQRTASLFAIAIPLSALAFLVPWTLMHPDWLLSLSTFRDQFLRASIQQNGGWIGLEPYIAMLPLLGLSLSWYLKRNGNLYASTAALFGGVILFISLFLPLVAPRIERYSQGAALDFYESMRGKEIYVKPLTMKSYAHLFYTNRPWHLSSASKGINIDAWEPWLLNGDVDRPTFFVAKVSDVATWRLHPNLRVTREGGGYVIFERVRASKALEE